VKYFSANRAEPVRQTTSPLAKASTQNIALIGFMAVGKSAVGRNLAKRLGRRFVDLDRLIEKSAGMKVREIFEQKGEVYFRQIEKQTLGQVLAKNGQVIATGGGVVLDDNNLALLRERTWLVALNATTETILTRVGDGATRPLLKGADRRARIEELLKTRQTRYAQAHVTIDTGDLTLNQVVDKIIEISQTKS
jgi:shikimate kinase